MIDLTYEALDYRRDRTFVRAGYRVRGSTERGFEVVRDGAPLLSLGPGFRPLRVMRCGVCSTDLARHLLPFDLPQVIGHEVVAVDEGGRRFVVEINASHLARGVPHDCAICRAGLATHCPDRVTLGIDRLPGGFGPWILAPVGACVPVPDDIGDEDAVLVEPLAAALQAVTTIAPRPGERIAVLGPRRLGMLVVASLASLRGGFTIAAIVRDPDLAPLARSCGADEVHVVGDDDAALERQF
ncbi:MAG TPA: threonine dehydrogenase, partial [bacterium]|nr:threonine dehydrogenase [bacterium]